MNKEVKRCVVYARVSTTLDSQSTSYETQTESADFMIAALEMRYPGRYVLAKTCGNAGVYAEKISGMKDERPEFDRMITEAQQGLFDIIITKSISRFARNQKVFHTTLDILKRAGVEVFFLQENALTDDRTQNFIISVYESLAQQESEQLSLRKKEANRMRLAKGKDITVGRVFGYKRDETGALIPDETEAQIVKNIFKMYVNDGLGTGKIAAYLNLHSPDISPKYEKAKRAEPWHKGSVSKILSNTRYAGYIYIQGAKIATPAIISAAEFDKAQQIRSNRDTRKKDKDTGKILSPIRGTSPWSGRIYCSICHERLYRKQSEHINYWGSLGCKCTRRNQIREEVLPDEVVTLLLFFSMNEIKIAAKKSLTYKYFDLQSISIESKKQIILRAQNEWKIKAEAAKKSLANAEKNLDTALNFSPEVYGRAAENFENLKRDYEKILSEMPVLNIEEDEDIVENLRDILENSGEKIRDLIKKNMFSEAEFLTRDLKNRLKKIVGSDENLKKILEKMIDRVEIFRETTGIVHSYFCSDFSYDGENFEIIFDIGYRPRQHPLTPKMIEYRVKNLQTGAEFSVPVSYLVQTGKNR